MGSAGGSAGRERGWGHSQSSRQLQEAGEHGGRVIRVTFQERSLWLLGEPTGRLKGQERKRGTMADNLGVPVMGEDGWIWNGGDEDRRGGPI